MHGLVSENSHLKFHFVSLTTSLILMAAMPWATDALLGAFREPREVGMVGQDTVAQFSKVLVARYLRDNGFEETLKAFSKDCAQSFHDITGEEVGVQTLEGIVAERIAFADKNVQDQLARLTVEDHGDFDYGKSVKVHNAEFRPVETISRKGSMAIGAHFCEGQGSLLLSYVDRVVDRYDADWRLDAQLDVSQQKFGAVKLCGTLGDSDMYYLCGLDGSFVVYGDASFCDAKLQCKLQQRMVTHIQFFKLEAADSWLVVSCGLDNHLRVHKLDRTSNDVQIEPMASEKLFSTCTALLVASHNGEPLVFITRSDHTHVSCYRIDLGSFKPVLSYNIALNNAEFSTFSFNVRDMVFAGQFNQYGTPIVAKGSSLLFATSHVPYMRLIEVEIPLQAPELGVTLYKQIVRNVPTEVDQDSYSEPILKLVPQGKEVLVGDSKGVYAVCILTGRSWLLDLPNVSRGSRVKCMEMNKDGTKLVVALSDKTVAAFDIVK